MTRRTRTDRTITLADDDRARIPFAMIAVLLLVASVGTIAVLEQRADPTIDRDAQVVMDRTETAVQSEFRTAVLDATHRAGAAPINTTAGANVSAFSTETDRTDAFRTYVKLLVYLEAVDRLPAAGQSIDAETESTVSIPPVATDPGPGEVSPAEAIDAVELEIGHFDPDVERGVIDATVHGAEIDAEAGGEDLPTETRSISVSVGSPIFELNDRMHEYEAELNRGFFEGDGVPNPADLEGLGQELAARLYPIAYMKAGWVRFGQETARPDDHAFEELIDTDHAEVLANHAIFSVQEDVFGTRDPYADRTMRPQHLCMSLDLVEEFRDVERSADPDGTDPSENVTSSANLEDAGETLRRNESNETVIPTDDEVNVKEEVCGDGGVINDWIFGDEATGELPDVPPLSELLQDGVDSMSAADQELALPVELVAELSYTEYHVDRTENVVDLLEEDAAEMRADIEKYGMADGDFSSVVDAAEDESYDASPSDIRDELYEIDVQTAQTSSSDPLPTPGTPDSAGAYERDYGNDSRRVVDADVGVSDVEHASIPDGDGYDRPIHEISAEGTADVTVVHGWKAKNETETSPDYTTTRATESVDVEVHTTINGEYGFSAGGEYYATSDEFAVDPGPIETDYGSDPDAATFEAGFEAALLEATAAESASGVERDVATAMESALRRSSPEALERSAEDAIVEDPSFTLESDAVIPGERDAVTRALTDELEVVHEEFLEGWAADPLRVSMGELTDDETPPAKAIDHIRTEFEPRLVEDGPYETPEEKARMQLRKAYFDRIYYWLELFDEHYGEELDGVNDRIDDFGDDAGFDHLDDVLDFVQGFANAEFDPDPVDLEGSPVLDDAQYEVSGAPTYLPSVSIDSDREPAIRPENATITETDSDVHHDALSIRTHNRAPWPGIPVVFVAPSQWYATVNSWSVDVAGEYARLEVSSTIGDPSDSGRLTYVAEHSPVDVELSDGSVIRVGKNEAVDFETSTEVVVVMPGSVVQKGGPVPAVSDGDFIATGTNFCSETWKEVGPEASSESC
ncbi:hypothetical protein ACFQGT_07255 [Natrialbaceae archaeon GCM10025810]|uniref:DUF7286 family protein n=1 Tax=Halovalidus salilacus TaxID=3075124 RepID=UPI00361A05E2